MASAGLLVAACSGSEQLVSEPRPVDWVKVGSSSADTAQGNVFPGRIQARESTLVSFEVGGRVASISYEIGDAFRRGAPLARIEGKVYQMRVREAQANLMESRAREAEAKLNLERQKSLFEKNAASKAELERAEAQLGSLRGLTQANAARVGLARDALSDAALRAPFAGRVARRLVEPGAQVAPGEPVLEIDGIALEVRFTVSSAQRDLLSAGDPVTVLMRSDAGDVIETPATISELSSRATGVGAFEVLASVPALQGGARPGQVVDVRIEGAADTQGEAPILIPITAFKPTGPNTGEVMVIDQGNGRLRARPVSLGKLVGDQIAVISGLQPGTIIVKRGLSFVTDGEPVTQIGTGPERYSK